MEDETKSRKRRRGKGGSNCKTKSKKMLRRQVGGGKGMDELIQENHRKIQVLREDHAEMLSTRASLQHDLAHSTRHLRHLADTARNLSLDRDAQVTLLLDQSLRAQARLRAAQALLPDHAHLRTLADSNARLSAHLNALLSDLATLPRHDLALLKDDLHALRMDLLKGRAALEFEEKTRSANLLQYQAMETKLASMANEIQSLRRNLPPPPEIQIPIPIPMPASNPAPPPPPPYLGNSAPSDMRFRGPHYPIPTPMYQATVPVPVPAGDVTQPPASGHYPFVTHHSHAPS